MFPPQRTPAPTLRSSASALVALLLLALSVGLPAARGLQTLPESVRDAVDPRSSESIASALRWARWRDAHGALTTRLFELGVDETLDDDLTHLLVTTVRKLGLHEELDALIERVLQAFPDRAVVLERCAYALNEAPDLGVLVDGKFRRGDDEDRSGLGAESRARDRVRQIRWLLRALELLDEPQTSRDLGLSEPEARQRTEAAWWLQLARAIDPYEPRGADGWYDGLDETLRVYPDFRGPVVELPALHRLTDLDVIPTVATDLRYFPDENWRTLRVDSDGDPVQFPVPSTFEDAKNDGERIRFALDRAVESDDATRAAALAHYFGIQRVRFGIGDALEGSTVDLKRLEDDEVVAVLPSGPTRISIPAEHHPIAIGRALANAAPETVAHHERLAQLFVDRGQLVRAASILEAFPTSKLRARLTDPVIDGRTFDAVAGRTERVSFRGRNVTTVDVEVHRIDLAALWSSRTKLFEMEDQLSDAQWNALPDSVREFTKGNESNLPVELVRSERIEVENGDSHEIQDIEIELGVLEPGPHVLVLSSNDGAHRFAILFDARSHVVVQRRLEDGSNHYFISDIVTGEPAADLRLEEWTLSGHEFALHAQWATTNASGELFLVDPPTKTYRTMRALFDTNGRIVEADLLAPLRGGHDSNAAREPHPPRIVAYSNRPIYRPGDTVHVAGWLLRPRLGNAPFEPLETKTRPGIVAYQLVRGSPWSSDMGETEAPIVEGDVELDPRGHFTVSVDLPERAPLGRYMLRLVPYFGPRDPILGVDLDWDDHSESVSFRCEEYRKPDFEVTIDPKTADRRTGESCEVVIRAHEYSGSALPGGRVRCTVRRLGFRSPESRDWKWDWLYGAGLDRPNRAPWAYPHASAWRVPEYEVDFWNGSERRLIGREDFVLSETLETIEGTLDARGEFTLAVDAGWTESEYGEAVSLALDVEVRGLSRRTVTATREIGFSPPRIELDLWTEYGYYSPGERIGVQASAWRNSTGVEALDVEFDLLEATWQNGELTESPVAAAKGRTDAKGRLRVEFAPPPAGQYRIVARAGEGESRDERAVVVRVHDPDSPSMNIVRDPVELVPRRATFEAGTVAEILLSVDEPGRSVLVVDRVDEGISSRPRVIEMTSLDEVLVISLDEDDAPCRSIEVSIIHRGREVTLRRKILVPPAAAQFDLEVEAGSADSDPLATDSILPGSEARVTLTAAPDENALDGLHAILTVYDRALESFDPSLAPRPILESLWRGTTNDRSYWSHPRLQSGLRARSRVGAWFSSLTPFRPNPGGTPLESWWSNGDRDDNPFEFGTGSSGIIDFGGDGGGSPGVSAPRSVGTRSRFADSAVFRSPVEFDAMGRATVLFPMPDDLTDWRVRAWAVAEGSRVAEAETSIRTEKPLQLRWATPRFLVSRDEAVLAVVVTNGSAAPQSVEVTLDLDPAAFEIVSEEAMTSVLDLAAGERARIERRVRVKRVPEDTRATVRALATSSAYRDEVERSLPIRGLAFERVDSVRGSLVQGQRIDEFEVLVEGSTDPRTRSFELRLTNSILPDLVTALPYLMDYEHQCSEQTMNRFLPLALVQESLESYDLRVGDFDEQLADEQQLRAGIAVGLEFLLSMQNFDGGWSWFAGADRSSVHTTAVVLRGLASLRRVGIFDELPWRVRLGVHWLESHQRRRYRACTIPDSVTGRLSRPTNLDAYVEFVLAQWDRSDRERMELIFSQRSELTPYSLALLGLAFERSPGGVERRDQIITMLRQFEVRDAENETRHLDLGGARRWYWDGSETETLATYIQLLETVDSPRIPELARYLLSCRRTLEHWDSTRDTGLVVEALLPLALRGLEDAGPTTIEVRCDDSVVRSLTLDSADPARMAATIEVAPDLLTEGVHRFEIEVDEDEFVQWMGVLRGTSRTKAVRAGGLDLRVDRRFEQIVRREDGWTDRIPVEPTDAIEIGALYEVVYTIDAKHDLEYVHLRDPKAAGIESVRQLSGYISEGLWPYLQLGEESLDLFFEQIPRGKHSVRLPIRGELIGTFTARPAVASAMYSPDLRGNSESRDVRIDPAKE